MLRPGGRRRRRRSSSLRRVLRWLPAVVLAAVVLGLVVGSVADVSAQSSSYRQATDRSYSSLAGAVVQASNRSGAALSTLMTSAPTLTNAGLPFTARAQVQQGLDDAVATTTAEARQTQAIATPSAAGTVSAQLSAVMAERRAGTSSLRSTVDQLLGMTPLPISGSPSADVVPPPEPLISAAAASVAMGNAGAMFEHADAGYRALLADIRRHRLPIELPSSAWVTQPTSAAPLGAVQLDATAPALAASTALASFHHLALTAVGLEPPAVPPGPGSVGAGPGVVGVSCAAAQSTTSGSAPTVLPPTSTLVVEATVTNCGTVPESGVGVTLSVTLSDPPGTAPPPAAARGGTRARRVTLASGGSSALDLGPVGVAGGHQYLVTVSLTVPPGEQSLPQGATQQFLVQITSSS